MNLPTVISDLVQAQADHNSHAYAHCFSDSATVYDEGKTYQGKAEIQQWIANANRKYQTKMRPIAYSKSEQQLKAEISGNFEGSPLILKYHFDIKDGLIHSLKNNGSKNVLL